MKKVSLIVTGSDEEVHIDLFLEDEDTENDGNPTGGVGACISRPHRVNRDQFRHMNTLLVGLRQDGSE